jgi:hypothetical protein
MAVWVQNLAFLKPFIRYMSISLLAGLFATTSSWCQNPYAVPATKTLLARNFPAATRKPIPTAAVLVPVVLNAPSGTAPQSGSLFDALASHIKPVTTTVEVYETERELDTSRPEPFQAGGQEVISTAGDFGDISRFLQTFPGVVATSDLSNEVVVRGGHPMENLFLVDGIEVPNINHMATLGTTGGFGPMIDAGVVQGLKMYTGGYDARYPERLSSVTEIQTLDAANSTEHAEADLGIQGFGGLGEKRLRIGDLLVSAHCRMGLPGGRSLRHRPRRNHHHRFAIFWVARDNGRRDPARAFCELVRRRHCKRLGTDRTHSPARSDTLPHESSFFRDGLPNPRIRFSAHSGLHGRLKQCVQYCEPPL